MSVVLVAVEPLLLPLLLAAGVPAVLLSRWASRTEFAFAHRLTAMFRRRHYLRELMTVATVRGGGPGVRLVGPRCAPGTPHSTRTRTSRCGNRFGAGS